MDKHEQFLEFEEESAPLFAALRAAGRAFAALPTLEGEGLQEAARAQERVGSLLEGAERALRLTENLLAEWSQE